MVAFECLVAKRAKPEVGQDRLAAVAVGYGFPARKESGIVIILQSRHECRGKATTWAKTGEIVESDTERHLAHAYAISISSAVTQNVRG